MITGEAQASPEIVLDEYLKKVAIKSGKFVGSM